MNRLVTFGNLGTLNSELLPRIKGISETLVVHDVDCIDLNKGNHGGA